MKKLTLLAVILAAASFVASQAQARFGLGAVLGDPTGLSIEADIDETHSWDGAIAWSSGKNSGFHIHGDYLINYGSIAHLETQPLEFYYGIGGRVIQIDNKKSKDDGKTSLGARVPAGLQIRLDDPRIEFFGEVGFVLDLVPSTSADFDVGIGGRYYF